jgi:hypothetical protein
MNREDSSKTRGILTKSCRVGNIDYGRNRPPHKMARGVPSLSLMRLTLRYAKQVVVRAAVVEGTPGK